MYLFIMPMSLQLFSKITRRFCDASNAISIWHLRQYLFLFGSSTLKNHDHSKGSLSHLQKQKIIRRIAQGIYDYPQMHNLLGAIPPDLTEVAKAIAEKTEFKFNQLEPMLQI